MNRAMPITSIVLIALLVHLAGCKEKPHPRELTGEARAEVSRLGRHINDLDKQGDYPEAEKAYREYMAVFQRELGPEHPATLSCRVDLAMRLHAQGKSAQAEQECRAALKVIERVSGVEDMWTLWCHVQLASILRGQNKNAEAEKEYRDTLAAMDRVNRADPSDGTYPAACCYGLGLCLESEGKLPEALQLFQRAEKVWSTWYVEGKPARNPAKEARERIEAALKK